MRPKVRVEEGRLLVSGRLAIRLERTLRVPNDGTKYPLPPALGAFPVYRMRDYSRRIPKEWLRKAQYLVPLYQAEALWLRFETDWSQPSAVQVACGGINALTGDPFPRALKARPQNYLVCPDQPWLDGFKTEENTVRQFVAAPLGSGLPVEEQIEGSSRSGGLQIRVFKPRPGAIKRRATSMSSLVMESVPAAELGLAAGGAIEQKVYPDPYGVKCWDPDNYVDLEILIVNAALFEQITGEPPPPSPVSAAEYSRAGLPWFELYDEEFADIRASERLSRLETVKVKEDSAKPQTIRGIRIRK